MIRPLQKPKLLGKSAPEKKVVETKPEKKEAPKKETKKLPPDTYIEEFDPIEIEVDETRKFVISVKRGGEFGLPMCDLRQYQTTDMYTGFTKKGVNFPVELLPELIDSLREVCDRCEEKELIE